MKIKWYFDVKEAYEALVWENGNTLLLDEDYTTKAEAKVFYGCDSELTRPPQSWMHVEDLGD